MRDASCCRQVYSLVINRSMGWQSRDCLIRTCLQFTGSVAKHCGDFGAKPGCTKNKIYDIETVTCICNGGDFVISAEFCE